MAFQSFMMEQDGKLANRRLPLEPLDEKERAIIVQAVLENFSRKELKIIFKEAIDDWVDRQFTTFGKWSFYSFAAAAIGALTYFIITMKLKGN